VGKAGCSLPRLDKDADQTLRTFGLTEGTCQFTWQALDEGAQFCLTRKINPMRVGNGPMHHQNEERFDNLSTKADILKALNRPDEAKTT